MVRSRNGDIRVPLRVKVTYLAKRPALEKQASLNNALLDGAMRYLREEGVSSEKVAKNANYAKIQA